MPKRRRSESPVQRAARMRNFTLFRLAGVKAALGSVEYLVPVPSTVYIEIDKLIAAVKRG